MALIRWNPWNIREFFEDDFDLPTIPGLSRLGQGLNLYESQDALVAEVALPGITEDQIDVTVDEAVVRVSAQTSDQKEERTKRRYFMSSMASTYNYSFRLPEGLVADQEPQAHLSNGVLTLTFPKVKKEPPKKVKVLRK